MSTETTPPIAPEPHIKTSRQGLSLVWFIPVVALLLGGWLVFQNWTSRGPLITVSFENAAGIESGVTLIKYRDVAIGKVEAVEIGPDFSGVVVSARVDPKVAAYLNDSTKIWIERPRVGTSGVSGLGTLFSGAHIGFEATLGQEKRHHFVGLEQPPLVDAGSDGIRITLNAKKRGSLAPGSPVYYKTFRVGTIEGVQFADDFNSVVVQAFVESSYSQLVNRNSRFWNVSGVSAQVNSEGISVSFQSIESLLIGGIEFDSPNVSGDVDPLSSDFIFELFDSFAQLDVKSFSHKLHYIVNFDQSIRGLNLDAQVEYRGIKIGRVVDIKSKYYRQNNQILLPVVIEIEPERLGILVESQARIEDAHRDIMRLKLHAKLEIANFLTGQLFVSLGTYDDEPYTELPNIDGLRQLPTINNDLTRIAANVDAVLQKINQLEVEQIIRSLDAVLVAAKSTIESADKLVLNTDKSAGSVAQSINNTLAESQKLLASGQTMFQQGQAVMESLDEGSATRYELDKTLKELQSAAKALKALTETIEKNPNSLIFGKQNRN